MPKLNLKELEAAITPAAEPAKIRLPKPQQGRMQRVLSARLVASEYLRNGLDIRAAYESVTHKRYTASRFNAMMTAGNSFMEEINIALKTADVEKNKVLALLWAQATTSPLDFMDDNGVILPIATLKKLPREFQALIEEVKVTTTYVPVRDDDNKIMKDKDGKPLLKPEQHVHLKFPSKQAALNTIAQIGKMVGPAVLNNTTINMFSIGAAMAEADAHRGRLMEERASRVIEHDPKPES